MMSATHTTEAHDDLPTDPDTAGSTGRDWFTEIENSRQRIVGLVCCLQDEAAVWFPGVLEAVLEGKNEKELAIKFVELRMQIEPWLMQLDSIPVTVIVDSVETHYRVDCQLKWTFAARVDMEAK
jgi:hypothetical protein